MPFTPVVVVFCTKDFILIVSCDHWSCETWWKVLWVYGWVGRRTGDTGRTRPACSAV